MGRRSGLGPLEMIKASCMYVTLSSHSPDIRLMGVQPFWKRTTIVVVGWFTDRTCKNKQ